MIQTLFVFRLLDTYFTSLDVQLPPFTAEYLEYRVLNERGNGFPILVYIRDVAKRLLHESADGTQKQEYSSLVKQLCGAVSVPARIFQFDKRLKDTDYWWHLLWTSIESSHVKGEIRTVDENIYVAAVLTQTLPIVRQWIGAGKNAMEGSYLFGSSAKYAIESGNDGLAKLLLSGHEGCPYRTRNQLLLKAAELGRFEIVEFIFHYKTEQFPWIFSDQTLKSERHGQVLWKPLRDSPSREVHSFIMEQRKIHPVVNEYKP